MARLILLIIIALAAMPQPAQAAPAADAWPWSCWPEDWFELTAVMDDTRQITVSVRNVGGVETPVTRLAFWAENSEGVMFYDAYVDLVPMRPGEVVGFPVRIDIYQPAGEIRGWYAFQGFGPSCPTHSVTQVYRRMWFPCASVGSATHCDGTPTQGVAR